MSALNWPQLASEFLNTGRLKRIYLGEDAKNAEYKTVGSLKVQFLSRWTRFPATWDSSVSTVNRPSTTYAHTSRTSVSNRVPRGESSLRT